ncbi:MAG: NFACT family protein, partial [Clostridia bacterium]|nr:NFACT family protein [Clostridia bacterium]
VQNYYDPELSMITIPLNPAWSPSTNAAKYFKDYKKSYTAEQTLTELIDRDEREIEYLESVLETIERSNDLSDLAEIREELVDTGYLRAARMQKRKPPKEDFRTFVSPEGFRIMVGKNNRQNDRLTTRIAAKNDLWFHVKNIPGSHVIVFCDGKSVGEETILYAANLAAYFSKATASAQVPVDYTPVKFVKKPNGALPGMVIYTTNQTVYVTPKEVTE